MVPVIVVIATTVTIATVIGAGTESYTSIAREFPGTAVVVLDAVLRSFHEVFSVLSLGSLAAVLIFTPRTAQLGRTRKITATAQALVRLQRVWATAVLLLIVVDGLNTTGVLFEVHSPEQLRFALTGTFYPAAWLIVFATAFTVFSVSILSESWAAYAVSLWIGMIAILAPVVISQVLVGPNHDFGVGRGDHPNTRSDSRPQALLVGVLRDRVPERKNHAATFMLPTHVGRSDLDRGHGRRDLGVQARRHRVDRLDHRLAADDSLDRPARRCSGEC